MQRTPILCCRSFPVLLLFFIIVPLYSQQDRETSPFSLGIIPQMQIPLGEDQDIFNLSGGTELAGRLQLPLTNMLDLAILMDLEYQYTPVKADTSISTLYTCAGTGLNWNISRWFLIGAFVKGGYFYSLLNDTSDLPVWVESTGGGNLCISEGLTTEFRILPGFSLGLTAAYRSNLGFSRSIAVSLSGYYHFPKRTAVQQGLPYGDLLISG